MTLNDLPDTELMNRLDEWRKREVWTMLEPLAEPHAVSGDKVSLLALKDGGFHSALRAVRLEIEMVELEIRRRDLNWRSGT